MTLKMLTFALLLSALFSCEFRKSVNKDLVTGLTTRGNGLSCDDVYLSDGENRISRNSFIYGEKIYLNFKNIEGFKKEDDFAFPGMQILVVKKSGDTVMQNNDLYADYAEGINFSSLVLNANITIARPIVIDKDYTLYVNIWDKKGEGTYKAALDFEVASNDQIIIESDNISYDNIYLYSEERKNAITDNNIKYNETVYMIFEGLTGFREEGGKVFPELEMKAMDSEGNIILNEGDLMDDSGMEISVFRQRISPNFLFTGSDINTPITCEILIWDKKSDNRIKASVQLNIE